MTDRALYLANIAHCLDDPGSAADSGALELIADGAVLVEDTPANIAENADVRAVYLGERRDG